MPVPLLEGGLSAEGGLVATSLLAAGDAAAFWSAMCPSLFTVRSPFFHGQDAHKGNIRSIVIGGASAIVLSTLVGWAASRLVGSWLPLIGVTVVNAAEVGGFYWAMENPATEDR